MLAWVYDAVRACPQLDSLLIATDSEEVAALCRRHDWPVALTSPELHSGSDRVHAIAKTHPAELYINVQADEPLLRPEHITALLGPFATPHIDVTTLKVICPAHELANPNTVKVVTSTDHRALYFSRAPIPHQRDPEASAAPVYKHLGLYAYRAAALARFHALAPSPLEQTERLEQLRFLENGVAIHVALTPFDTIGVDTEDDLRHAEAALLARNPKPPP